MPNSNREAVPLSAGSPHRDSGKWVSGDEWKEIAGVARSASRRGDSSPGVRDETYGRRSPEDDRGPGGAPVNPSRRGLAYAALTGAPRCT